jgi:hypothetical protein
MITTRVKIASQRENENNVDFLPRILHCLFHGAALHHIGCHLYSSNAHHKRFGQFDGIPIN